MLACIVCILHSDARAHRLTRLEAEVAVGAVLDRFDEMAGVGEPVRRMDVAFRVLEALPVTVSRRHD